jgi:hypothetical protein
VIDEKGTAVTDYSVLLFPENEAWWTRTNATYLRLVTPELDGSFKTAGVLPGRYRAVALDAVDRMDWANPDLLRSVAPMATTMDIKDAAPTVLTLTLSRAP